MFSSWILYVVATVAFVSFPAEVGLLSFQLLFQAWNPATEEQCIDRCHRLGQRRKVIVTKVREAYKHSSVWVLYRLIYVQCRSMNVWFLCSAVHCQRFSGGEDDRDPEAEAGPDGESVRLHGEQSENIPC